MSDYDIQIRPILFVDLRPETDEDNEKLEHALKNLVQQDPSIRVEPRPFKGETRLCGMSESHLQGVCDRLLNEFKIKFSFGEPTVIYLETIRKAAEGEGKYIRQTGGLGNYAHCQLRLEPCDQDNGYQFINACQADVVSEKYIEPIHGGVQSALKAGILAGYSLEFVKVSLLDGSYHETDSNEMAFRFAAAMALRDAARKASPVLLEPVMAVEVIVPPGQIGAIISDINVCRGRIEGIRLVGGSQVIRASVPLGEILSYDKETRARARGHARHTMRFARYEPVPYRRGTEGDGVGVAAIKPTGTRPGSGFAAAQFDTEPEERTRGEQI